MKKGYKRVLLIMLMPPALLLALFLADPGLAAAGALLIPPACLLTGIVLLFTPRKRLGWILLISAGITLLLGVAGWVGIMVLMSQR